MQLDGLPTIFVFGQTRNVNLTRYSGLMEIVLPRITLSEEMVIASAHFRVALHQIHQGNLRYKDGCFCLQKDESHCAIEGLWRPQAIPLVVPRYGKVDINEVTHHK